jgi:hypothetical protein
MMGDVVMHDGLYHLGDIDVVVLLALWNAHHRRLQY